jgi:hypothetical protein
VLNCLERFSFSCTGSTAVRSPSSGDNSRGLKPAARNTETGNALMSNDALQIDNPIRNPQSAIHNRENPTCVFLGAQNRHTP